MQMLHMFDTRLLPRGDDQAQSRTEWGSHRRASNLLKNLGADRELSHVERAADDIFNVADDDLPSDGPGAASSGPSRCRP